jgi:adenine phosphoribosyltransferase
MARRSRASFVAVGTSIIAMLTVWLGYGFCLCLAGETISESYITEYSTDKIEMHTGAVHPGQKVVLVGGLGVHQSMYGSACLGDIRSSA